MNNPRPEGEGSGKKMTLQELLQVAKSQGVEVTGIPEDDGKGGGAPPVPLETQVETDMGGFQKTSDFGGLGENPSAEVIAKAEEDWRTKIKVKLYETMESLRTQYPNASEDQVGQAARSTMGGDVIKMGEAFKKIHQQSTESDSESEDGMIKLTVESESGAKSTGDSGPSDFDTLFGEQSINSRISARE